MKVELLYKFFKGEASDEEIFLIKNWVEQSDENKNRFIMERKIYDVIQLNTSDENLLREYMDSQDDSKKLRYRIIPFLSNSKFKEVFKIAAVILITFFVSLSVFKQLNVTPNLLATQTITAPAGQRVNLTLPDGTSVWLNSKSTLQYPILFGTKVRDVYLEGQAYFDVAKNKVPFIVNTSNGTVKALGTEFDVLSDSKNEIFETMLFEGAVEVGLLTDSSQKIILEPNQKAVVINNILKSAFVEDKNPYEWRNGLICFREMGFKEIMSVLEKTYDIKIIVLNPNIEKRTHTGKFRVSHGVQYALNVLSQTMNFEYDFDYEKQIIYVR
ncbi:MAG: FecR family protein [Bacteroidales bacterium]|nr:FecR family protein [Bacteroidales bacterium]